MRLKSIEVYHQDTGAKADFWLPKPLGKPLLNSTPTTQTVTIGKQERTVSRKYIEFAQIYNAEQAHREKLRHDCGVFALSCFNGDLMTNVSFTNQDLQSVEVRDAEFIATTKLEELNPPVDSFVITTMTSIERALTERQFEVPHLAVVASVDEGPPLYLSKLGVTGPVVLANDSNLEQFYPFRCAGLVYDLALEPS